MRYSMAKPCPDCGITTSDNATMCPDCGAHMGPPSINGFALFAFYTAALLFPCVGALGSIYPFTKKRSGHGVGMLVTSFILSPIFYSVFAILSIGALTTLGGYLVDMF
jgi:hypothetical protein